MLPLKDFLPRPISLSVASIESQPDDIAAKELATAACITYGNRAELQLTKVFRWLFSAP